MCFHKVTWKPYFTERRSEKVIVNLGYGGASHFALQTVCWGLLSVRTAALLSVFPAELVGSRHSRLNKHGDLSLQLFHRASRTFGGKNRWMLALWRSGMFQLNLCQHDPLSCLVCCPVCQPEFSVSEQDVLLIPCLCFIGRDRAFCLQDMFVPHLGLLFQTDYLVLQKWEVVTLKQEESEVSLWQRKLIIMCGVTTSVSSWFIYSRMDGGWPDLHRNAAQKKSDVWSPNIRHIFILVNSHLWVRLTVKLLHSQGLDSAGVSH